MRDKFNLGTILIYFILLLVVVATLYPFIYMIAVSLSKDVYVLRGEISLWPKGLNFKKSYSRFEKNI